ncbi:MAG TPA: hypothetical protein VFO55_08085 [Gemmatimonadaceae bacterium]|nr:hypothetical protein [Gemmatimonadaceae bacterium]
MKRVSLTLSVAAIAAALSGCRDVQGRAAAEDTSYRLRPGYVIDSVKPPEVELSEFRAGLGPAPTRLSGGAASFDRLMSAFARAVEGNDSLALQRMQLDAAEFAWLIYPSSPYTKPPYRESPRMVWLQLRGGDTGLRRLLERRGGERLELVGWQCDPEPAVEGENRLWRRCSVRTIGPSGDTLRERLFGVVVERHGHFKFASYQNQY